MLNKLLRRPNHALPFIGAANACHFSPRKFSGPQGGQPLGKNLLLWPPQYFTPSDAPVWNHLLLNQHTKTRHLHLGYSQNSLNVGYSIMYCFGDFFVMQMLLYMYKVVYVVNTSDDYYSCNLTLLHHFVVSVKYKNIYNLKADRSCRISQCHIILPVFNRDRILHWPSQRVAL